jgi:hypothetical protein
LKKKAITQIEKELMAIDDDAADEDDDSDDNEDGNININFDRKP